MLNADPLRNFGHHAHAPEHWNFLGHSPSSFANSPCLHQTPGGLDERALFEAGEASPAPHSERRTGQVRAEARADHGTT